MKETLIKKFIQALDASGLEDSRKTYWLDRFRTDDLTPAEEQEFIAEASARAEELELAIALEEAEAEADTMQVDSLRVYATPELQLLALESEAKYATDLKAYKVEVSALEDTLSAGIQDIRTETDKGQIDDIRKKLGLS